MPQARVLGCLTDSGLEVTVRMLGLVQTLFCKNIQHSSLSVHRRHEPGVRPEGEYIGLSSEPVAPPPPAPGTYRIGSGLAATSKKRAGRAENNGGLTTPLHSP